MNTALIAGGQTLAVNYHGSRFSYCLADVTARGLVLKSHPRFCTVCGSRFSRFFTFFIFRSAISVVPYGWYLFISVQCSCP